MENAKRAREIIALLPQPACPHGGGGNCPECVSMCEHKPCWPTPDEAQAIIAAGFGDRLMVDKWIGDHYLDPSDDILLLSPAPVGREGDSGGSWSNGRCTFLTREGLCSLHPLGLKPAEGRLADCTVPRAARAADPINHHELVAATWNTDAGQALVTQWRRKHREFTYAELNEAEQQNALEGLMARVYGASAQEEGLP